MVVVLSPLINFYPRFVQRSKPVRAQAFLTELAVEAFDERVLSGFFRLYKAKCDTGLPRPKEHDFAGEFGTVVAHHFLGWLQPHNLLRRVKRGTAIKLHVWKRLQCKEGG